MENQSVGQWPEASSYGKDHKMYIGHVLLFSALQMCFLLFYLLFPHWLLLVANVMIWFSVSALTVIRLHHDHVQIVNLRRMYVEYFDYCVAIKRSSSSAKQAVK